MQLFRVTIIQSRLFKSLIQVVIILFYTYSVNAQISAGGLPLSMNHPLLKSTENLPEYHVKSVDIKALEREDEEFPVPFRYGIFEKKEINIKEEGLKINTGNPKGIVWRYKISANDFYSVQLKFSTYILPEGAKLYIYNEDYSKILGAFTSFNNNHDNALFISILEAKHAIIEYFEPINPAFNGQLILEGIVKVYKELINTQLFDDQNGYIGVNCKEGENWQNAKHAVCMISFLKDGNTCFCSGALLNNEKRDGIPYFLTANHCVDETVNGANIQVSFNYEHSNCYGELHDKNQYTISGASLLTTGSQSDFTLLLLNHRPPPSYQPYYAGWNASNNSVSNTAGIHHPGSNPKKISIDNDPPETYASVITWTDGVPSPENSHWKVNFDKGKTYHGSSGSPLFDNNNRVIGQLHGGDNLNEFYGKLSYSWNNPNDGFNSLSSYLDPENTGTKIANGAYSTSLLPDPQVYIDFQSVCQGALIQLSGFSAFEPVSWNWEFVPDNVSFHDGTSASSPNPVVSFDTPGLYSINLTVSNEKLINEKLIGGDSTISLENYIKAGSEIEIIVHPTTNSDSCLCRFDTLGLIARGAYNFTWDFQDSPDNSFYIIDKNTNPITIRSIGGTPPERYDTLKLVISGSHGSCSSIINYSFPFLNQPNDNLANASQIFLGINGEYSNKCATKENNEPEPPAYSCTEQNSWCDEYNSGKSTIENSVWFYYYAESDDQLTLKSDGFNNQMAMYLAESPNDIFNENYILVAANDDYSTDNTNPTIEKFNVQSGKTYWIQVDGSNKGKEGYFYLNLKKYGLSSFNDNINENKILIYPQPAIHKIFVESNLFNNSRKIQLDIFDIEGIKVSSGIYNYPFNPIDISTLTKGVYLLQLTDNQTIYSCKFIK